MPRGRYTNEHVVHDGWWHGLAFLDLDITKAQKVQQNDGTEAQRGRALLFRIRRNDLIPILQCGRFRHS